MSDLTRLDIRIQEIGVKCCPDYPDIRNQESFGYLWAIEQTLEGVNLANQDLHKIIEEQQKQINKLNKERTEWIAVTSEMESEINELKAGEDWYKNRLAELKG